MKLCMKILISVIISFAQFVLFVLENVARVPTGFGKEDENLLEWNGTYHECNRTKFENYTLSSYMRWPPMKYVILIRAGDVKIGFDSRYVRTTRSLFGRQREEISFDQIYDVITDFEDYNGHFSSLKVLKTWRLTEGDLLAVDSDLLNNPFFLRLIRDIQQIISTSASSHPTTSNSSLVCPINDETFSNNFVLMLGIDIRTEDMNGGMDKYRSSRDGLGKFAIEAEDFLFGHGNKSADILTEFIDAFFFRSSLIAGITIHVYLKIAYLVVVRCGKLTMMLF